MPWEILLTLFLLAAGISENNWPENDLKESMERGAGIYQNTCIICHKEDGQGMMFSYPPLAGSDFLMNNTDKAIQAVKFGLDEEITVNGAVYYNEMPAQGLSDQEVADVMNYILNSWGNQGDYVTVEKVSRIQE